MHLADMKKKEFSEFFEECKFVKEFFRKAFKQMSDHFRNNFQ